MRGATPLAVPAPPRRSSSHARGGGRAGCGEAASAASLVLRVVVAMTAASLLATELWKVGAPPGRGTAREQDAGAGADALREGPPRVSVSANVIVIEATDSPTSRAPSSRSPTSQAPSPASDSPTPRPTQRPTASCEERYPGHASHFRDGMHAGIQEYKWGQLCNSVQLVTSLMEHANASLNLSGVALGPWSTMWLHPLNLTTLARSGHSVYMGCTLVEECHLALGCTSRLQNGVHTTNRTELPMYVPLWRTYFPGTVWYAFRPALTGFSPVLAHYVRPRDEIMEVARAAVERARSAAEAAAAAATAGAPRSPLVLGLHRRYLDGYCYVWAERVGTGLDGRTMYECAPGSGIGAEGGALAAPVSQNPRFKTREDPCFGMQKKADLGAVQRECYLNASMYYSLCDFSFTPRETAFLRAEWPAFARLDADPERDAVLIASDGQRPDSEQAMRERMPLAARPVDLTRGGAPGADAVFRDRPRAMFADSWALALSDLAVENPMSSCASLLAHWRLALGRDPDTLFPSKCFAAFADSRAAHEAGGLPELPASKVGDLKRKLSLPA